MKKLLTACLFGLGAIFALNGCKPKEPEPVEPTKYTVEFYMDETCATKFGSPVEVEEGKKVTPPATNPVKEADENYTYEFDKWLDFSTGEEFDFNTAITKKTVLYADYSKTAIERDFDLVVYMYAKVGANLETLKAEYAKVKSDHANVTWVVGEAGTVAPFSLEVNEYDKAHVGAESNVIIAHTQVTSGHANGLANAETYNYHFAGRTVINPSWSTGLDTNYYAAYNSDRISGKAAEEAEKIIAIVAAENPDYFVMDTAANLKVNETKQLEPKNYAGANDAAVVFATSDANVATVSTAGLITAVGAGTCVVTGTKGHKVVEVAVDVVAKEADLVVYFAGHTSTKITLDEANAMIAAFKSLDGNGDLEIKIDYSNLADAAFGDLVRSAGNVDFVVGSNNLNNETQCNLILDETYGKTSLGAGWVASTGRYVAIMGNCADAHKATAVKLFNLLTAEKDAFTYGDKYFTLNSYEETIKVGSSFQLVSSDANVTYSTANAQVATVTAAGLVSGVAAGTTKIAVTNGTYSKEFTAIIEASNSYNLVVTIGNKFDTNLETLKAEYAKVADPNCIVVWNHVNKYQAADIANAVREYDEANPDHKTDLVIGHNQVWSKQYLYLGGEDHSDTSYWYELGASGVIVADWGAANNTYGIAAHADDLQRAEAVKIANILKGALPTA